MPLEAVRDAVQGTFAAGCPSSKKVPAYGTDLCDARLVITDLQLIDGEPCVRDLRLGERARLSRERDIRSVIKNNELELQRYGPLRAKSATPETGGPRMQGKVTPRARGSR
jgi:hypothetical protein